MERSAPNFPPSCLKQPASYVLPLAPDQFCHPVFLTDAVFLLPHFFSTSPAPFKDSVLQRCSPSRVCDERGQAAPLTAARH